MLVLKIVYIIFKRYEPDELLTAAFLLIGLPAILGFLSGHISLISAVSSSFFVHYATILTLVLIYRLGPWHPLANYPGPIWCKVSMMHMALKVVGGKRHEYIRALHDKYGDIVRSGESLFTFSLSLRLKSCLCRPQRSEHQGFVGHSGPHGPCRASQRP